MPYIKVPVTELMLERLRGLADAQRRTVPAEILHVLDMHLARDGSSSDMDLKRNPEPVGPVAEPARPKTEPVGPVAEPAHKTKPQKPTPDSAPKRAPMFGGFKPAPPAPGDKGSEDGEG